MVKHFYKRLKKKVFSLKFQNRKKSNLIKRDTKVPRVKEESRPTDH